MAKSEAKTVGIVDTEEALAAKIAEVRAAQAIFATYTQEQVDKIFKAAAIAANKAMLLLTLQEHTCCSALTILILLRLILISIA